MNSPSSKFPSPNFIKKQLFTKMNKNLLQKQQNKKNPSGPLKKKGQVKMKVPKLVLVKSNKKNNNSSALSVIKETKSEPLVKSYSMLKDKPDYSYQKDGSVILTNTEMLISITTATTVNSVPNGFNLIAFPVNAGLKSTFPFLSSIASNYVSYDFINLSFGFVSRSNYTQNGLVMFQAEFDPSKGPPENRIEFLNRQGSETQVFKSLVLNLKQKDMKKEKSHYIRIGKLTTSQDIKLYDTAMVYFAYEGTPSTSVIGDIVVKYSVRLLTPYLRIAEKQIKNQETCQGTSNGTITVQQPFGPAMTAASFIGDFVGNFLYTAANTATGGLIGQVISTGKSIAKYITFLTKGSGSTIPDSYNVQVAIPQTNSNSYMFGSNFNSDQIFFINEQDADLVASAYAVANMSAFNNLFLDISSTNVAKVADYTNTVSGISYRYTQFCALAPANSVLRFYNNDTTTTPVVATVGMTDFDGRKLGLLNPNTVQFFGND